jgi:hypothetical protein
MEWDLSFIREEGDEVRSTTFPSRALEKMDLAKSANPEDPNGTLTSEFIPGQSDIGKSNPTNSTARDKHG